MSTAVGATRDDGQVKKRTRNDEWIVTSTYTCDTTHKQKHRTLRHGLDPRKLGRVERLLAFSC